MKINQFIPDSSVLDVTGSTDKSQSAGKSDSSGGFVDILKSKLDEVNDQQVNAEDMTEKLIKGDGVEIHQVMLAQEEAKMSLSLAIQVRNKLVEAYQELSRTQL